MKATGGNARALIRPIAECALLPAAMLGFAAMTAYFFALGLAGFARGTIGSFLISRQAHNIGTSILERVPHDIAHRILIRYLMVVGWFLDDR